MSTLHHRLSTLVLAVLVAVGLLALVPATAANAAAPSTGRYTGIDTTRAWSGSVGTTPQVIPIARLARIPATATAVVVNVEVSGPTAAGYVRVTPAGSDPSVATQVFTAGQTIANLATVGLTNGSVQVKLSAGSGMVYLDVAGYYADGSGSTYTPLAAARVFSGPVGTVPVPVQLAGQGGVPADATAVVVNTEVGSPTANGYVRVTPFGSDPQVATQVFTAGRTISNLVIVKLVGGRAQVKLSRGAATVFMDVAGYYSSATSGSVFVPVTPARAFAGTVTPTPRQVRLTGTAGVPGTATAVVANAEVGGTTANGYLRIVPAGQDAQVATQVFRTGDKLSNAVMTKVVGSSVDRAVQAKVSKGSATLDLDVAGYFLDGSSGSGVGADVSWPQCGSASSWPTGIAFAVVGVNNGLASKVNPCLGQQLAWAAGATGGTTQDRTQLYVNTANPGAAFKADPTLDRSTWPTSNTDPGGTVVVNPYGSCSGGTTGLTSAACSYMYGWNRAWTDAGSFGVRSPGSYRWWLDAESDGSWQTPALNRATLEGMTAEFTGTGARVGLYSSPAEWRALMGSVPSSSPLYGQPSWLPIGPSTLASAQAACTSPGFTGGSRVQMVQYVAGGFDRDTTCV